jgi:hypothetical protein
VFLSMLWFFLFFIWIWLLIVVFSDIFRSDDRAGAEDARACRRGGTSAGCIRPGLHPERRWFQ